MTFINWSDSGEMLGLLSEYIADAKAEAQGDPSRVRFLELLSAEVAEVTRSESEMTVAEAIERLRQIRDDVDSEFRDDPVVAHLGDCIEELIRIERASAV